MGVSHTPVFLLPGEGWPQAGVGFVNYLINYHIYNICLYIPPPISYPVLKPIGRANTSRKSL